MKKRGEKGSDGLMNAVRNVKLLKTDIRKRLEDGRTIRLTLICKAQLLTIISDTELKEARTLSQIIEKDRIPQIVIIASPFEPSVSVSVSTVPKDWKPPKSEEDHK